MVRLKDVLTIDGLAECLYSSYREDNDPDGIPFLENVAVPGEENNTSRTYLALDMDTYRMIGFFTIVADEGCTPDHPSYTIARVGCAGPDETERALVHGIAQLFAECGRNAGCCSVTARCGDEKLDHYVNAGFLRLGRSEGLNVMALEV